MTPEQQEEAWSAHKRGRPLAWIPDSATFRQIIGFGYRRDEDDALCAYVAGGKSGDFINLDNVELGDIYEAKPFEFKEPGGQS